MKTMSLALVLAAAASTFALPPDFPPMPAPLPPSFPEPANDGYTGVPAPSGMRWVKYGSAPWKLEPVAAAAAPVPKSSFKAGVASGTTPVTGAPTAGTSPRPEPALGSFGATTPTAPTRTYALPAAGRGGTNCLD